MRQLDQGRNLGLLPVLGLREELEVRLALEQICGSLAQGGVVVARMRRMDCAIAAFYPRAGGP